LIRGLVYCRAKKLETILVGRDGVARIDEERFSFNVWNSTSWGGVALARSIKSRHVIEVLYGLPTDEGRDDDS